MKKEISLALLSILLCLSVYHNFTEEKTVQVKTEYIKGDTITIRDTVFLNKIITKNKIIYKEKTDPVTDQKIVESKYQEKNDSYAIKLLAFAPVPVDSFQLDIDIYNKKMIITDTIKIERTVIAKDGFLGFYEELGIIGILAVILL